MKNFTIFHYPEQVKSLRKLLHSMDKVNCNVEMATESNVKRLKNVIWENPNLMVYLLTDGDEQDAFTFMAERWFVSSVLCEERFLRLLAKESLTNRIVQAYLNYEMSEGLKYRIRECIVAYELYL